MDENEKQKDYSPTLKAIYWIAAILCVITNVFGFGRSGSGHSDADENSPEQEQSGEKSKHVKRGGFGNAARRRGSWGTG